MNCPKCGFSLTNDDMFCKNCGTAVTPQGLVQPVTDGSVVNSTMQPVVGIPVGNVSVPSMMGNLETITSTQPAMSGPGTINNPSSPMVGGLEVPPQPAMSGPGIINNPSSPMVGGPEVPPQPAMSGPGTINNPSSPMVGELEVPPQPAMSEVGTINNPSSPMVGGLEVPPQPAMSEVGTINNPSSPMVGGLEVPPQPAMSEVGTINNPSSPIVGGLETNALRGPTLISPEMMNEPVQPMIGGPEVNISSQSPIIGSKMNVYNSPSTTNQLTDTAAKSGFMDKIKGIDPKFVIIGVLGILVIIIIVLVCILIGTNNDSNSNLGEAEMTSSANNSYKISLSDFVFNVPNNYIYDKSDQSLMMGDEVGTWLAQFRVIEGKYDQLENNKNKVLEFFKQNGYECTSAEEKTVLGVDFITFDLKTSGADKALIGYSKIDEDYIVQIVLQNRDNEVDYKLLEKVAPVIKNVEMATTTSSLLPNTNFNVSLPNDIIK